MDSSHEAPELKEPFQSHQPAWLRQGRAGEHKPAGSVWSWRSLRPWKFCGCAAWSPQGWGVRKRTGMLSFILTSAATSAGVGEGLELFQGPLRAGHVPQPGFRADPALSKALVWDK